MINGVGFFEVLVILILILMFFGSKELPQFIREGARFISKVRRYSDKVRRELDDITQISPAAGDVIDEVGVKKNTIRKKCIESRRSLTEDQRKEKSQRIIEFLFDLEEFKKSRTVMFYASLKSEVQTFSAIEESLAMQKRVILPYCKPQSAELGIAEIHSIAGDLELGAMKVMEPVRGLWDNFLKSDIHLVVCPGVGFDKHGARLGQGKGCYDYFLKELKGKVPIIGLAYQCQVLDESLPFDYHDVPVDILITEEKLIRFDPKS